MATSAVAGSSFGFALAQSGVFTGAILASCMWRAGKLNVRDKPIKENPLWPPLITPSRASTSLFLCNLEMITKEPSVKQVLCYADIAINVSLNVKCCDQFYLDIWTD